MRITKVIPRRIPPANPQALELINKLTACSHSDLIELVSTFEWTFQKSDFFHWIPVLNRFDEILQSVTSKYALEFVQKQAFETPDRLVLLAVLKFSKFLWENCTNRSLYASFEHLTCLLRTIDLEVLEAVLSLLLKPAQRINSQRSLRSGLQASQSLLEVLSAPSGLRDSLQQANESTFNVPPVLNYQFYRSGSGSSNECSSTDMDTPAQTPSKPSKTSRPLLEKEGMVTLNVVDPFKSGKSIEQVLSSLMEEHKIPESSEFALFHKLRIIQAATNETARKNLLVINVLALSVYVNMITDEEAHNKIFLYEPDLVTKLTSLLDPEPKQNMPLETAVIFALDSLGKLRVRLSDVLSALGASTNHGALMLILRRAISLMDDVQLYPQSFLDALFSFTSFVTSTQSGGGMLISGGIITALTQAMTAKSPTQLKNISKCIGILDNLMYGLISAFNNFTHANGLDTLVARIKSEVEVSLQIAQEQKVDIYYDRATLLRSMLKLILHLMQTSGTSHRMRNLIESSLPQSLLIIFRYSSVFGAGIYGIAVNIMASFIHDEPTSLSILQEYGLPQAFLASVSVDFPISTEVVSAIPNAFGAICLNSVGMDAFKVANPMDRYFEIFTQETHVRALGESDVPHLLGNSVDELMRHHPSLKEDIMEAIIKMLRTIQKNGEVEYENELNVTQLSLQDNMEPAETPEKEDGKGHVTRSSTFIDLIARFLEGLFQNTAHCREFIRLNGVDVLLQFYRLKTLPFDFAASSSSSSLSYLFRLLIEVNSQPVITSILSSFSTLLQDATGLLPQMNQESHFLPFFKNSSDISNTLIALNRDFRHLISFHCYASLFADIFTTHIFSHNKSLTAILQMLGNETPILVQLVRLHRFCISESISLKYNVSGDSLNASNETLSGKETLLSPAEMIPKELGVEESIADGLQSKGQLGNNARYLRFILGQIPVLLTPFFQVLTARRTLDTANRAQSQEIVRNFGEYMSQYLNEVSLDTYDKSNVSYVSVCLSFISVMLTDDRGQPVLQTSLTLAFMHYAGLDLLCQRLGKLWTLAKSHGHKHNELCHPFAGIEIILGLFRNWTDAKFLHESTHTANLLTLNVIPGFSPFNHLVFCRKKILGILLPLWRDVFLTELPYKCVKNLFACIVNIYRADGEIESASSTTARPLPISSTLASAVATLSASIMSRQTATRPGEEQVEQLIEMGFPRNAAENALVRLGNSVQRAAEYLLIHPDIVSAESSEPPADVEHADPDIAMEHEDDDEQYETDDSEEEKGEDMMIDLPNPDIALNKDQLQTLRRDLESDIVSVALTVMDKLTDIAPEVKDIIVLKGRDSLDQVVADLVTDQVKKLKETTDMNGKKLANRLRILALLINDPSLIAKTLKISKTLTLDLLDLLDAVDVTLTDNEDILSSMLVIIEAYLSLSEEPKLSTLNFPLDISKQPEDNTEELPPLSLPQKEAILSCLLKILRNGTPGKELLNAVLRLIVHLTKTVDIARSLVESDGLALLLQRESLGSFAAQQSFLVMIFRHLLESHTVLQNYVTQDIQSWLSVPRPRVVDMNAYIKHGGYMVCREPQTFVEATKKLCSLTKYDPSIRSLQVTIKQDLAEERKEEVTAETLGSTDLSQTVAGFLIKFLLDCQSLPQDEVQPTNLRTAHSVHIAKCTAMQLIAELVSSYPFFKVDLVNMSNKKGKLSTPHRLKNSFFNYLLNELLPVKPNNMDEKLETQEKKKLAEATWAGSVLTAMCCSTTKSEDDSLDVSMKKSVVDSIIRTMKDTIGSEEKLETKYSKYFSVSTLIGRIMNFKSVESHVEKPSADVTLSLAKIMLEKNMVSVLTQMLAEIDPGYPNGRQVIASIVKPLEHLSKLALKVGKPGEKESGSLNIQEVGEESEGLSEDMDSESEHAISEITRNSALAMFQPPVEEDSEEHSDNDLSEEGDEDMFDEFSDDQLEEMGSEEQESDVEEEMEILVPAPYHGNQDMEFDDESDSSESDDPAEEENEVEEEDGWEDEDDAEEDDEEPEQEEEDMAMDEEESEEESELAADDLDHFLGEGADDMFGIQTEGTNRNRARRVGRRQLLEAEYGADGLEIHWDVSSGRPRALESGSTFPLFGRGNAYQGDEALTHPLLVNPSDTSRPNRVEPVRGRAIEVRGEGNDMFNWQTFDELVGGNALQILEQIFNRTGARGGTGAYRLEINPSGGANILMNGGAATRPNPETDTSKEKLPKDPAEEKLAIAHSFTILNTCERWTQETKLVLPSRVNEKCLRVMNDILNGLIPEFIEKEKVRKEKEAEKKRIAEEERRKKEEEEALRRKEEEEKKDVPMEDIQTERQCVTIRGRSVDITGSGIDPEFIEALPDELKEEVIAQYLREQRTALPSANVPDTISEDFLNALPAEIREEVLMQERLEAQRRSDQRGTFLSLTNEIAREVNETDQSTEARSRNPAVIPSKRKAEKSSADVVQLLDKGAISTLLKQLFVAEPVNKAAIHRLLINLSENGKSRADLISLMITSLVEEALDTHITPKSKGKSVRRPSDVIPNLVPQRTLELLAQLVSVSEKAAKFCLLESDHFQHAIFKSVRTPKKLKGKEKLLSTKSPVVILFSLLDRPAYSENQALVEQLLQILSTIMRTFVAIVKKQPKKEEASSSESVSKKNTLPNIPEECLCLIIKVLSVGTCTTKTFQFTLSVIQHLSVVPDYRKKISEELSLSAQKIGDETIHDLQELHHILSKAEDSFHVDSTVLSKFSSSGSQQAKLLRVLKTIDFIHSKNLLAPKETDDISLETIYNELNLKDVWNQLGGVLKLLKEELLHVATVLLPLIESFLVISKPYVNRQKKAPQKPAAPSRANSELHRTDEPFIAFTEEHRKILNTMVRNNPSLMSGSFSLLVHNPKILDFDNKRTYFSQQLHKKTTRDQFGTLQISVRRQYVFEDSYHQLHGRTGDEIKYSKLNVKFYDEEGVDAGGVTREWFSVLARQMFNPDYALFKPSAVDRVTYQPNRASWINPDHLSFFKFVGRIIGKAIYDGRLLDAYFTRSFYKCILGINVDWRDMEAVDPEFFKSLEWILNNDITDVIDLTFSCEVDDFGKQRVVDLKPDGRNIPVTEENKQEYVNLITEQRLTEAIRQQIEAFDSGFSDVIPKELIRIFNEQELELLISGLPDIDIDDWKNNTEYQNYTASSPQIIWFWRAVRSFSQEERAKLLQFATGTSKIPLEGFSHLQGQSGVQKFQIHKDFASAKRLPSAHTCFNQVDLPEYETYEDLRSNLLTAISECGTGFGFA